MANYRRQQRSTQQYHKINISSAKNSPQYFGPTISDQEALKIHGLAFENGGYSSDSDSGKSSFDEDYYKYKPKPLQINKYNTVTVKSLYVNNRHLETKSYLYNTRKKDLSGTIPTRREPSSSYSQQDYYRRPPMNNKFQNPYIPIQPNLINNFTANTNNFKNVTQIPCSVSNTNQAITIKITDKTPVRPAAGPQIFTPTLNVNSGQTYHSISAGRSVVSSTPSNRNFAHVPPVTAAKSLSTSQAQTRRENNVAANKPQNKTTNLSVNENKSASSRQHLNHQSVILNAPNLSSAVNENNFSYLPKFPNHTSVRRGNTSVISNVQVVTDNTAQNASQNNSFPNSFENSPRTSETVELFAQEKSSCGRFFDYICCRN